MWYSDSPWPEDVPYCFWYPQGSPKVRYGQKTKFNQRAITLSAKFWHIWYFATSCVCSRGIFSNKTGMRLKVKEGSRTSFLFINWDRNVRWGWELRHCDLLVILLWYDPWPQFDLWWPLVLFVNFWCFFKLSTPFLDVKGTFRSIMSMGWPLYDLHIRNYRGSKGSATTLLSITWDRNVRRGRELRHCDQWVVLLWFDPWPQFDLWWPLMLFVNFLGFLNFWPHFWMSKVPSDQKCQWVDLCTTFA